MRLLTALTCLVLAPAAVAAEQIQWPSPFTSGTVLTYGETTRDRSEGDEPEDVVTRADVTVRMASSGDTGGLQRWEWGPARIDVRKGSTMTRQIYKAIAQSPVPAMEVSLDADGRYAGVANLEVFGAWIRQTLGPAMTTAMADQYLADDEASDADEARMLAEEFVSDTMDMFAGPEAVEAGVAWTPTVFNAWFGGTWEAGRDYTADVQMPSDTLLRRFPATLTYRFTALDGGKAQVTWSTEVEQGRLQMSEQGLIRFDRTSGVPEYYEANRTERMLGQTSTSRTTYELQTAATP